MFIAPVVSFSERGGVLPSRNSGKADQKLLVSSWNEDMLTIIISGVEMPFAWDL